jgi:lipoprotein-anchoring transpeptidase ErfK/SrfK
MQGDTVVNSFLVSTGKWPTVTVQGVYRVYVKYRAADMYGADYYLSDVPYIMYFYEGYGLHGAYWHMNFGHPMSHGCVNMKIPDAAWIFDFAEVGTIVSVHP